MYKPELFTRFLAERLGVPADSIQVLNIESNIGDSARFCETCGPEGFKVTVCYDYFDDKPRFTYWNEDDVFLFLQVVSGVREEDAQRK